LLVAGFAGVVTMGIVAPGVIVMAGPGTFAGVGVIIGTVGIADCIAVTPGTCGAALHPASMPASSVETIAIIMTVFFILFTFPFFVSPLACALR
jgi:hypothetical protein